MVLDPLWVTDTGNMCHYAGRIRILWLLLPEAVYNDLINYDEMSSFVFLIYYFIHFIVLKHQFLIVLKR